MKEKVRTVLLQNPDITLPEAARTLGKDSQNNKSFGLAYWQARALLMEELTGKTIRTLLENTDRKDLIIKDSNTDRIDNEGHINNMDHMNEGPVEHDVSEEGVHIVPNFDIYDF